MSVHPREAWPGASATCLGRPAGAHSPSQGAWLAVQVFINSRGVTVMPVGRHEATSPQPACGTWQGPGQAPCTLTANQGPAQSSITQQDCARSDKW